ncbi:MULTISPECIES: NAD(P)-dependent oxidoreductase [Myroides]|uniref:NAD(P)H-binding protein n=1 Tax=Myroides albus TaxID=2562892 RepID=A0A6I3LMF6_9FLAO|nr:MULTISPECIES: NAD(P)H-binding protein [Myroides]MTG99054.1 NAD(P)H-binding protein [Myroides albus]MVX36652.1 NAD(P)H-binding protein [Myroides sp. LoEW2-1]UVD80411.1 NAD(P)H-binding protein [Myroides albus]
MQKVVLIGATGYVGKAILKELVYRNIETTAMARNIEAIAQSSLLTLKSVDVMETDKLTELLKGADTVISAFNAGWTNPNLYDDYIQGATSIHQAVKDSHTKRLIVIGGAGTLYIKPNLQLVNSADFPDVIKPGALAAKDYFEKILSQEESFNWTYCSPAIEMNPTNTGVRTGRFRYGTNTPVYDSECRSRISVEDLAVAIIDEVNNKQLLNRQFTIGY